MKINTELIKRCCSKNILPSGDSNEFLARVTHLYLQEQRIRKIENLDVCKGLLALYLYDNLIQSLENLEQLSQLLCLHLRSNVIERIENLHLLTQLTCLNLSRNSILMVEGLDNLTQLQELQIDHQKLPPDQPLQFSQESILAIADSLQLLDVSGNRLATLRPLKKLQQLRVFHAEDNHLDDLQDLVDVVGRWFFIRKMRLAGNPVCGIAKYQDNMVVNCMELEELDGKVIAPNYRDYLLNWRQHQELQGRKSSAYALLRPFLESQINNRQLSPIRQTAPEADAPTDPRPERSLHRAPLPEKRS